MKKEALIILGITIFGLAAFGYFQAVPDASNFGASVPRIDISPKEFAFGDISYGDTAEHAFLIKNVGSETLEIKRVATSCSCTTARVSSDKIEPGQTADLLVSYDTGAMSGPHGLGEQERIIFVKSSDPVNPQAEVKIKAYVR